MTIKKVLIIWLVFMIAACSDETVNNSSENLRKLIEEGYNNADYEIIDLLVADNYMINKNGAAETSKEVLKDEIRNLKKTFKEYKFIIDELFSIDNTVVMRYTFTGKDRTFDKPVTYLGLFLGKFENEKLVEGWQMFDNLSLFKQLGYTLISPEEIQKQIMNKTESKKNTQRD